ncbi:MAG TPA: SDR family oxidoreductase [Burkholderiales bacterium]|nr:SDR family oxidoreductase [Burkholderiales bacterium]
MANDSPASEFADLFELKGRAAYIPGGYGAIGEAIAWGLAQRGARVAVSGRDAGKAEKLAAEIRAAGFDALGVAMDAHSVDSIRESTDRVAKHYGGLDILVNCVGIQREELLLDVTEEAFDEVYQVNLKSAMFLAQAAAKYQIAGKRGGKQVHLLSVRSHFAVRARGYSAYCSTKGALVLLVRQHAMELAPHGITVNGVAPTVVNSEMGTKNWQRDPKGWQALLDRIPLGRVADPKDVVGPTLMFCAPASDFITGQVLYIDGGITSSQ